MCNTLSPLAATIFKEGVGAQMHVLWCLYTWLWYLHLLTWDSSRPAVVLAYFMTLELVGGHVPTVLHTLGHDVTPAGA